MNSAKELQKQHEKSVCDILFRSLNLNAEFEKYGNDINEPDCIYKLNRELLGIEVATAYYEDSDAKQEWTLARGEREFPKRGYEERWGGVIKNPSDLICIRIHKEIIDKCSKKYSGTDKIWLCIEERAPLSNEISVKECLKSIQITGKNTFQAIYLLHLSPSHEGGNYKAFKIYGD
ncbi:MAG: hypothetical protein MUO78_10620 [candidate division Zixibacteria bacterium]|nr:hypothetical protein [candidate division Zixibacteria bacterium]